MSAAMPASPARSAEQLREEMVTVLVEKNAARSPEIIRALRAVPRHLVEGPEGPVDVESVYDPFNVTLRKQVNGISVSSVSAPQVQAIQLEQAAVRLGQRVLEIGSGGVNAAYLAELVGEAGMVATIDIDDEIAERATRFLAAAGYPRVQVLTGDAGLGVPDLAPFDVILVTVETTDIPNAWWEQLAVGGRIVAPVRWRGQRRTVALKRQGANVLAADDIQQAGFVPMQGVGEERETLVALHDVSGQRVMLRVDGDIPIDVDALRQALLEEKSLQWTGTQLHRRHMYAPLDLWLATVLENMVVMTGDRGAYEAGIIPRPVPIGWPVLVEGASLAYRTLRPVDDDEGPWEVGVIGHGPAGAELADRYAAAIRAWDPQANPRLTVTRPALADISRLTHPHGTHRSVRRRTSTFTISWS